jgi:hypothetical protein
VTYLAKTAVKRVAPGSPDGIRHRNSSLVRETILSEPLAN